MGKNGWTKRSGQRHHDGINRLFIPFFYFYIIFIFIGVPTACVYFADESGGDGRIRINFWAFLWRILWLVGWECVCGNGKWILFDHLPYKISTKKMHKENQPKSPTTYNRHSTTFSQLTTKKKKTTTNTKYKPR